MEQRRLIGVVASAIAGGVVFLGAEVFFKTGCNLPHRPPPFQAEQAEVQEAKNLLREERWAEALERFTRVQLLYPTFSPGAVRQYRELCAREVEVAERLAEARRLLLAKQYVAARRVLAQISDRSQQVPARNALRKEVALAAAALVAEAERLQGSTADREQLVRMRELADEAAELGYVRGQELREAADDALRELDEPWLTVIDTFDEGDVGAALVKAKACAKQHEECRTLVAPLSKLAPQMGRLAALPVAKLSPLLVLARQVSEGGGEPAELIADALGDRYETRASRCRDDENWQCVSRDLLLARDLDRPVEDETLEDDLNEFARNEILRAEQLRLSKSSQARPTIQRVLQLRAIEQQWMRLAQNVERDLMAAK